MKNIVVEIENLKKTYDRNQLAVDGISLTIRSNESWALVGPNGAGKSTLLNCLLGLIFPTSGKIKLFGDEPNNRKSRISVGYQAESFFTYGNRTAQEVLRLYGTLSGMNDREIYESTGKVLELFSLSKVKNKKVGTFSKGMTQRLGLAQSLLHDPDFIVWDEPSSGLDPEGRHLVIEVIRKMKEQRKTILFSTHVLADAEKVCDHIAIIDQGAMVLSESLESLRSRSSATSMEDIYLQALRKNNA
jgi:ABC-2 type transport system ATP-binding protein